MPVRVSIPEMLSQFPVISPPALSVRVRMSSDGTYPELIATEAELMVRLSASIPERDVSMTMDKPEPSVYLRLVVASKRIGASLIPSMAMESSAV